MHRRGLVLILGLAVAVMLFVAAVAEWRMTALPPKQHCPPNAVCFYESVPYRIHPLRAKLLWSASAVIAIGSLGYAALPLLRTKLR